MRGFLHQPALDLSAALGQLLRFEQNLHDIRFLGKANCGLRFAKWEHTRDEWARIDNAGSSTGSCGPEVGFVVCARSQQQTAACSVEGV